jgi:putative ABC transport system permease protein
MTERFGQTSEAGMDGVALKMLFGDRAKYIGLIFGIAFSTMLMSNQRSRFLRG